MAEAEKNFPTRKLSELKKWLDEGTPIPREPFYKELPAFTIRNLPPPYPDYPYFAAAEHHPFRPGARDFDIVNAWWLADAATLVYSEPPFVAAQFARAGLARVKAFDRRGTQCFVASNDEFAVVAFRGSESRPRETADEGGSRYRDLFIDWVLTDFDFLPEPSALAGEVHGGFQNGLDLVWEDDDGVQGLGSYLAELNAGASAPKVWVTGHSLGAALATLCAARCESLQGVYVYGSPRVGDKDFGEAFARRLRERFGGVCYRFVNNRDLVTTVPLPGRYRHVGSLKYIDRDGRISDNPSFAERMKNKLRSAFSLPFDEMGRFKPNLIEHFARALVDHAPTLYAVHVWNTYVKGLK